MPVFLIHHQQQQHETRRGLIPSSAISAMNTASSGHFPFILFSSLVRHPAALSGHFLKPSTCQPNQGLASRTAGPATPGSVSHLNVRRDTLDCVDSSTPRITELRYSPVLVLPPP
ncbi:hypothetical protein NEUTE1DRAFT_100888 [Neurospora tetrasperma FGSC 2508]|uniref:Uncharacterized protein n=1 Tax=Neurospora tetrasperma (strain FGSC 2508 / ATCC MYA-4615 / P0657) TaxID=510951 RepID=F8MMY6_NEUT8|nr:uncharacterized protein NEUTE1DRAFT_100888 [Neurospora tetrasperma FGSC 2508]EGO58010.1 hypothetical protein NEUTE1DRAFT_100888 [Neurospora tetrasperma FGSC 2508]EGZ71686.1 hypothetical protein NEUTE2DRAFT_65771 [Neurospora tetrasperma FGSC 2509]